MKDLKKRASGEGGRGGFPPSGEGGLRGVSPLRKSLGLNLQQIKKTKLF